MKKVPVGLTGYTSRNIIHFSKIRHYLDFCNKYVHKLFRKIFIDVFCSDLKFTLGSPVLVDKRIRTKSRSDRCCNLFSLNFLLHVIKMVMDWHSKFHWYRNQQFLFWFPNGLIAKLFWPLTKFSFHRHKIQIRRRIFMKYLPIILLCARPYFLEISNYKYHIESSWKFLNLFFVKFFNHEYHIESLWKSANIFMVYMSSGFCFCFRNLEPQISN